MKEKDITQKTLEGYNEVFADIVNVLLFDGEEKVLPEDLSDATTISQYKTSGIIRSQDRDVAKRWKNGTIKISLIGLENQTEYDPDMPLRIMSYDGAAYRDQLNRTDEADSGTRYPVVTLVLYFGLKSLWGEVKSLKERLDIPEELDPYVNDYRLNLFEVGALSRKTVDKFKSDFWVVADFCYQMYNFKTYTPSSKILVHPQEVLRTMSAFTHDDRYEEIYNDFDEDEVRGGVSMCDYLDKIISDSRNDGYMRGQSDGQLLERENVISHLKGQGKTTLQIVELTGYSEEEVNRVIDAIS